MAERGREGGEGASKIPRGILLHTKHLGKGQEQPEEATFQRVHRRKEIKVKETAFSPVSLLLRSRGSHAEQRTGETQQSRRPGLLRSKDIGQLGQSTITLTQPCKRRGYPRLPAVRTPSTALSEGEGN